MSELVKLIQGLCPTGVEFKKIKEVYKRIKGTAITAGKMKEIENPDGDIRVFAGGKTVINAFEEDIPNANITRIPAVLVQSRGVIDAVYYDKPFTFKNEMWAYTAENPIAVKFLYYVLKNNVQKFRDAASGMGALPQISLPVTEDFVIPVPPIEVQDEIVRILDNFTELTTELTTELATELTARKKQYEFYKEKLFSFDASVPVVTTSNISLERFWLMPATPKYIEHGIPYITSKNVRNGHISFGNVKYISEEDYKSISKNRAVQKNDLLITMIGTIGETAFVEETIEFYGQNLYLVRIDESKCLRKYFYYFLSLGRIKNSLVSKKNASSQGYIKAGSIDNLKIPLPSLDEQARIVSILDRFDALCNDISAGLPAEIEARQKQYEYYRDKLLTFKEASE